MASALSIVATIVVQTNELTYAIPVVGVFAVAALRILPSMSRIFSGLSQMRQSIPAIHDLYSDYVMPGMQTEETKADGPAVSFEAEIVLKDVNYSYAGAGTAAVNDINITIKKGESVGFVGRSGAGKSTLADIILGLLIPSSGNVLVDGRDIYSNLRSWQSRLGYVPQDIYLCDGSIRDNIAFGIEPDEIDDRKIAAAIENAYLSEVVANLPEGVQTIVGEHGVRLSAGQRQRIGIARALYHEPDVIILDEATSSLDSQAEAIIADTIDNLKKDKTILIIAHRLTTVKRCHRLYLLENGVVSGVGSLDDLTESNELFKEITNTKMRNTLSATT